MDTTVQENGRQVEQSIKQYLEPATFIDSDHPLVTELTRKILPENITDPTEKAILLYYHIRDAFRYNPYNIDLATSAMMAHRLVGRRSGYCIPKAMLLAACGRVAAIPSRIGFAIVRNHIGTAKLEEILKTDKLVFHGYTEFFLQGKWVKATPAFDRFLCAKFGVPPLEFDGKEDSIFQKHNSNGDKFMEYLHDYGSFADLPYELMMSEFRLHYAPLFAEGALGRNHVFRVSS